MNRITLLAAAAAAALTAFPAMAQDDPHAGHDMPAPEPADPHAGHNMETMDDPGVHGVIMQTDGSGTSRLPRLGRSGHHGLHVRTGEWSIMTHGYAWGVYTDQSGPRGDRMASVQSMAMLSAERDLGNSTSLELRTMLSVEPAMGARGYPNLFATGETAGGVSLVDRQHPHDLFMELSARIEFPFDTAIFGPASLYVYGGPVAEPALGPSAFMHRPSARYLPLAPISHHWFDSTHISYGVVTLGFTQRRFQIEGSAFRGREPDERRWNIETPALDSWSVRATWEPSMNLLAQVSYGRITAPETLHPGQDEGRTTASLQYGDRSFNAMIAVSAKDRLPGPTLIAVLAEGNWNVAGGHNLFGRIELVENDELFPDHLHPLHDRIFRVGKFEGGYAYRIPLTDTVNVALGGSVMTYARPAALDPYYGNPVGFTGFVKLSLGD
ncbi:MAG: hypothetical protein ACAH11_03935 [Sphingomonas sp.]